MGSLIGEQCESCKWMTRNNSCLEGFCDYMWFCKGSIIALHGSCEALDNARLNGTCKGYEPKNGKKGYYGRV